MYSKWLLPAPKVQGFSEQVQNGFQWKQPHSHHFLQSPSLLWRKWAQPPLTPSRVFPEGVPTHESLLSTQGASSPLYVHPTVCISPDPGGSCLCWDRHLCHRLYFLLCFWTWVQLLGPRLMEDPHPIWPAYVQRRSWGCLLLTQFSSVQSLSRVWPFATPWIAALHHQLPEFTQTHAHRVSDATQPSHPLSSPSPPAPNPSQDQGLFQWVNSSHEVAKVLEFRLQHQSFQWTPRTDLL